MAEIEPKTREEKLWNGENIEPVTREEMYIKHIFDKTQTIPDHPITRKEMLMEKAGEGGGGDITIKQLTATENGTYSEEDTAYSPVIVNVPDVPPVLGELTVTENGTYTPPSGTDGYNEVNVSVQPKLETLTAIENDTYTPSSGKDGFSQVVVNVPPTPLDDLSVTENGTYNPTSGHGFDEVTVNVPLPDNAYLLKSAKDDVVSFSDGSDNFFRTLKAYIEPVQDLHGYDAPWVGGAGKNKCPVDKIATTPSDTFSLPAGSYTFSFRLIGTPKYSTSKMRLDDENDNNIVKIGVHGVSQNTYLDIQFTLSETTTVKVRNENITVDSSGYVADNIQIESGGSRTTFEPYSNECPISGWTSANVVDSGSDNWLNTSGTDTTNGYKYGYSLNTRGNTIENYIGFITEYSVVKPNQTYLLSGITGNAPSICIYDKSKNFIDGIKYDGRSSFTFDVPSNGYYVRASVPNAVASACQMNMGSTVKPYMPYELPTTYTIQFTDGSNPLTVYGGYVDVVSGVLVVDGILETIDPLKFQGTSGGGLGWIDFNDSYVESLQNNNVMCNKLGDMVGSGTGWTSTTPCIAFRADPHAFRLYGNSALFSSGGAYENTTIYYKLKTPFSIQLAPTQVKSLLGVNNVWADTGETEVEYFAKEVSA